MQTVFQDTQYRANGRKFKVMLSNNEYCIYWKFRQQKNYSGTFCFTSLEKALAFIPTL